MIEAIEIRIITMIAATCLILIEVNCPRELKIVKNDEGEKKIVAIRENNEARLTQRFFRLRVKDN